ncbi:hypothetical protein MNBD_GAMMA03-729 [hydrothermal vent metagenome]|uniref:LppC lipoprotein n=1 Tax=hydrothermal vent metagenome TaxID=652676 RepID=A0A3B0WCY8_9ZZZZ
MPFYSLQRLIFTSALSILIVLTGCSTPPSQSKKPPSLPIQKTKGAVKLLKTTPPPQLKAEELMTLSEVELKLQTNKAKQQQEWPNFILLNHQRWQHSNNREQAQIEQQIWNAISQQPLAKIKETINTLKQHSAPSVQQWGELLAILKGPATGMQQKFKRLSQSNSNAIYMYHLLPGFNMQNLYASAPKKLAILLPFDGKYEHVANQIKSGIMKAFMASDQKTSLKFYNSSNLDQLERTYQQAKQEGADFIIGPLRKEAIDHIITIADENVLALNRIEYTPFTQFSFKSADEVTQLIEHFKAQDYQNIGILSNDGHSDIKLAKKLKTAWVQYEGNSAFLSIYPDKKPKLRKALGALINEAKSKERYDTLRWATGHKLKFFPRTRQDFDAIIIIDNNARLAVFKPQFAFFGLNTPVYGTSQLSPKNLLKTKSNRDLRGVKFLAYPVIFRPQNLTSNFEAFGWDSFQVATQHQNLKRGGYLAQGKTGELTLKDQHITQHLVWAIYNKKGKIIPFIE